MATIVQLRLSVEMPDGVVELLEHEYAVLEHSVLHL